MNYVYELKTNNYLLLKSKTYVIIVGQREIVSFRTHFGHTTITSLIINVIVIIKSMLVRKLIMLYAAAAAAVSTPVRVQINYHQTDFSSV